MARELYSYLTADGAENHTDHELYLASPATAFLKYVIDAKDAVGCCIGNFPRKKSDKSYTKDAGISLQHITTALLPALMGHFETFQRYLFAGMFDISIYLAKYSPTDFFKKLNLDKNFTLDPITFAAYRGRDAKVGILLADNLTGWHNPDRVNEIFNAFQLNFQLYSNADCKNLMVLWQLRHSIVHTGGSITLPDSQKIPQLNTFGDKKVIFEEKFINELARRMHLLIEDSVLRAATAFRKNLKPQLSVAEKRVIDNLFVVDSSNKSWLQG